MKPISLPKVTAWMHDSEKIHVVRRLWNDFVAIGQITTIQEDLISFITRPKVKTLLISGIGKFQAHVNKSLDALGQPHTDIVIEVHPNSNLQMCIWGKDHRMAVHITIPESHRRSLKTFSRWCKLWKKRYVKQAVKRLCEVQ